MKKSDWREFSVEKPEVRGQYIKVTNYPKSESGYLVAFKDKDYDQIHEFFRFWRYLD